MSSSKLKLKEIKAIVRDFDVRDPRDALFAIEQVLKAKVTGKQKPVFRIDVFDEGDTTKVEFKGGDSVKPRHVKCVLKAIKQFVVEKQNNCNCPGCQAERADVLGEAQKAQVGDGSELGELLAGLRASGLNPIVLDTRDKDAN